MEQRPILGLDSSPGDSIHKEDPLVLGIRFHPAGADETIKGRLLCFSVLYILIAPKVRKYQRYPSCLFSHGIRKKGVFFNK